MFPLPFCPLRTPSMNFTLIVLGEFALGLAILFIAVIRFIKVKPRLRLPPGPRGLPVIGNVLDMPSEKEWLTFAQWGETWGTRSLIRFLPTLGL